MDKKRLKNSFSIEEVSEIAGVNSFTLRNWEDRYSLFTPQRDCNGRRIFSESDTIRAVVAADLTQRHHKIGKIAADLQNANDPHLVLAESIEGEVFTDLRKQSLDSILQCKPGVFHQNYMHLIGNYDLEFVSDHFFYPLYRELELMKSNKTITSFLFDYAQHQLSTRLHRLTGALKLKGGPHHQARVFVTGFPENQFEDSTLILNLMLERYGWDVAYVGPRTQINELQLAVESTQADLLILVGNNLTIQDYLRYEDTIKALSVPVVVGGRLALNLLAEGMKSTTQIELSSLRPGPFARLLKYKLTNHAPVETL